MSTPIPAGLPRRSESARCLIVDDDSLVRHALVRVIEGQGLSCLEAGSGEEALELLAKSGEA